MEHFEGFVALCENDGGQKTLFPHQEQIARQILLGKDVLVAMVRGSGVRTAIDHAILYEAAVRGKVSLYVAACNDEGVKRRLESLRKSNIACGLVRISDSRDIGHTGVPSVVVLVPADLAEIATREARGGSEDALLGMFDHIVVEDLHGYSAGELAHLRELLRLFRFWRAQRAPESPFQVTLTSHPLANAEEVAAAFFAERRGRVAGEDVIVAADVPRSPFDLHYWMPPLETELTPTSGSFSVRRRTDLEDLQVILSAVNRSVPGGRVLVWRNRLPLAQNEKGQLDILRNRFAAGFGGSAALSVEICDNLDLLPQESFRSFDVVLCISLPPYVAEAINALHNLASGNGGLVIVVLEEGRQSVQTLWSERFSPEARHPSHFTLPSLFLVQFEPVTFWHFALAINGMARRARLRADELAGFYPDAEKHLGMLTAEGAVVPLSPDAAAIRSFNPTGRLNDIIEKARVRYGLSSPHSVDVTVTANNEPWSFALEPDYSAVYFQQGMRVARNGGYHVVNRSSGQVRLTPYGGTDYLCYPLFEEPPVPGNAKTIGLPTRHTVKDAGLEARILDGGLSIRVVGFKTQTDPSLLLDPQVTTQEAILSVDRPYLMFDIVGISEVEGSRALAGMIYTYLRGRYPSLRDHVLVLPSNTRVLLVPLHARSAEIVARLETEVPELFEYLKSSAYDVLFNCLCDGGCPQCVKTLPLQLSIDQPAVRKTPLFQWLGKIGGREKETDQLIQHRVRHVPKERMKEVVHYWKERAVKLFRERMGMDISTPVPIYVVPQTEGGFAAAFYGDCVRMREAELPERILVEIVAHEYAHNWQAQQMTDSLRGGALPFEGKVFVEGFAQWVAFRIMDSLGLISNMTSIQMSGVDWNGDEYGEGFRLCRFIEERLVGFGGLVRYMQTGELTDPQTAKAMSVAEVLEAAGTTTRLGPRPDAP
jgi:hypothetical protein